MGKIRTAWENKNAIMRDPCHLLKDGDVRTDVCCALDISKHSKFRTFILFLQPSFFI